MTRVSKQILETKTQARLFSQFIDLFSSANQDQRRALFEALFSESEKIMFIKRLAMVLLILEGYSTYAIAKTLIVSDSTVRVIRSQCKKGQFDAVIEIMRKKTFDHQEFWKTVETLLQCGLPPRGKGRWKWFYEISDTKH